LSRLEHAATRLRAEAERALMRTLEGGCSVPIGVWTEITWPTSVDASDRGQRYEDLIGATLLLRGTIVSINGEEQVSGSRSIVLRKPDNTAQTLAVQLQAQAAALGNDLAQELKKAGADRILASIHQSS
jgi:hydroxymethylbilane synthase